jgi:hypothetical protein
LGLARLTQQREVQEEGLGRLGPAALEPVAGAPALQVQAALQVERAVRDTMAMVLVMGTAMGADMVMDTLRDLKYRRGSGT